MRKHEEQETSDSVTQGMAREARARPRVLVMAIGDLARVVKVIKVSRTLADAGYEVVRLGFKTSPTDPDEEHDESGAIIRLDPTKPFPGASSTLESSLGTSGQPTSDEQQPGSASGAREVLKRTLFSFAAGRRLRERVLARRRLAAFREHWWKQWRALERAGTESAPDLVIASQFSALPAGHEIARGVGAKLIYDSRDLWSTYPWEPSRGRFFNKLEKRYIRRADLVITVSPQSAAHLAKLYRIPKPTVIYNGSMLSVSAATEPHSPVRVLFQGHFMPDRGLRELVEAMESLRGVATLTLQGWGAMESELRDLASMLDVADIVRFAEPVEPTQVSLAANEHDVGVVNFTATTVNHRATVPNKLFDYMGGGLALVAVDQPGIRGVVEDTGCGIILEKPDSEGIAKAICEIAQDPARLQRMKQEALRAWHRYSWPEQGKILVREVDKLMSR